MLYALLLDIIIYFLICLISFKEKNNGSWKDKWSYFWKSYLLPFPIYPFLIIFLGELFSSDYDINKAINVALKTKWDFSIFYIGIILLVLNIMFYHISKSIIQEYGRTKCWLFIGTLSISGIAYFVFFHNPKPAEPELNFIETYHKSKDTSSQITEETSIKEPEPDLEELYLRTFDSLSFIDAAKFYCEVRKEYDLADSLFIDSIFPNFAYCSYLEIKEIKNLFQDTPLCDTINKMYISKRTFFIESIENELVNYAYEQATIFSDTIIPIILEEIDEQFAGDFELLINEYKGAIGRIFDSAEDFKREWRRKVNVNNYKALIDNNLYDYKVNLDDFYNSYLGNIGLNDNEYPLPTCQDLNLTIPNAIVNTYINNEQKKTWDNISDFAVDGGLIILEWATAGMATPIVTSVKIAQAGKTVYDIGNTVDELYFDNQAMSDDEKLMVTCADYMNVEVTDFLEEQYYTYLKNKTDSVINQIHNNL